MKNCMFCGGTAPDTAEFVGELSSWLNETEPLTTDDCSWLNKEYSIKMEVSDEDDIGSPVCVGCLIQALRTGYMDIPVSD